MVALLALFACTRPLDDREAGDRTRVLTSTCDDLDPIECLLPWPSSAFLEVDASTATGVRVRVEEAALPITDRVGYVNRADGFSRVSGVATAFTGRIDDTAMSWDPASSLDPLASVQILVAQPGAANYAERVPLRTEVVHAASVTDGDRDLVIGRPAAVMAANSDHVVVVLDTIGSSERPRAVELALGLVEPDNADEQALAAYHAPTRQVLADAGIDPARVVRVWDFTTRSAGDPTFRMHAMMDALAGAQGDLGVAFDTVTTVANENIAVIVRGRLTNAPSFLDDEGFFELDDAGVPQITGTADIPFRIMIPAGTGPYRVALYGHGTGGDMTDPLFDTELGSEGIAKLATRFEGWTGDDFVETLLGFGTYLQGSERSTAGLLQALAGDTVLLTAMDGVLGDALAADMLGDEVNPAAGRRANTETVAWLGGSMGGTMGGVMVSADPRLRIAVLNVPGAGWTHMIPHSLLWDSGAGSMMAQTYGDDLDLQLAVVMGQGSWDEVDGAPWADEALASGGVFLLQESIDDPILPNLGSELLASSFHAVQLEPVLQPVLGLESTDQVVTNGATLTQFWVPDTGQYQVHGFAAGNTPAGEAARDQILQFLTTSWAGAPEMEFPEGCAVTADGSCDFRGMWE